MTSLTIQAPAKLNLFLHITGKRPDGYHLLESMVAFTKLGDTLTLLPAETLELTVSGPFAASLGDSVDNLVMRAGRLLQEYSGRRRGAHIVLHKRLPVGSGIGGGSADAAAALRGLERLWGLELAPQTRHALALSLGSDVPVCLRSQPAWMRGVGDQLELLTIPPHIWQNMGVVLVNPNLPLWTAEVYRHFSGLFSGHEDSAIAIVSTDQLVHYLHDRHNALEAPATALLPVIAQLLDALRATDGCLLARMSGSGSTCFGLYSNEAQAQQAAQQIAQAHPAWWVQATAFSGEGT